MQAFVFNLRRKQFQDARVRQAFNLAFDFEQINKKLFYDQYVRTDSYFDNSELKATGLPQGRELEIAERGEGRRAARGLHHRVEEPGQRHARGRARQAPAKAAEAARSEAGWKRDPQKDNVLRNAPGETLKRRVPARVSPTSSASCCPTSDTWRSSASRPSVRIVDTAQYQRRQRHLRLRHHRRPRSPSRSRPATSSATSGARPPPTRKAAATLIGIKNPAIDKLIDKVIFAKDREELVAATRGARSRAAVELLCRAAVALSVSSASSTGTCSAGRKSCRRRPRQLRAGLVVRRRSRQEAGGGTRPMNRLACFASHETADAAPGRVPPLPSSLCTALPAVPSTAVEPRMVCRPSAS